LNIFQGFNPIKSSEGIQLREQMIKIPCDDFWGNGKDGKGQNHTGKILVRIRKELK